MKERDGWGQGRRRRQTDGTGGKENRTKKEGQRKQRKKRGRGVRKYLRQGIKRNYRSNDDDKDENATNNCELRVAFF